MKKFFTLATSLLLLLSVNAQLEAGNNQHFTKAIRTIGNHIPANHPAKPNVHNTNSRATNFTFQVDYSGYEESNAAETNADFFETLNSVNRRYPIDSIGTGRWANVVFDTLIDIYTDGAANVYPHYRYPYGALTSLRIDTVYVGLAHVNTSHQFDTIRLRVMDLTVSTTIARDSGFTGAAIFTQDLIIDTSLTGVGTQPGQYMVRYYPFVVNTLVPMQHKFAIQVDYFGPIADEFFILSGYSNDCGPCGASSFSAARPAAVGSRFGAVNNSFLAYNFGYNANNVAQIAFNDEVGFDCNGNGTYAEAASCELDVSQAVQIIPQLIVDIPYGTTVTSDSSKTCPNQTIPFTANPYGSTGPYTYQWSVTGGTAASSTDQTINVFVNGSTNVVANVTVTDASSATVTASFTLNNRAITLSITNPNPTTINCNGGSAVLATTATGYTQGAETYSWSPVTGTGATQTVTTPGNYSVTVTNSAGCTSTASVAVQYPGVSNTVAFTLPQDVAPTISGTQLCPNVQNTFGNTSSNTGSGWTANWEYGDGGTSTDGLHVYLAPGVYVVKLTMDSAGCSFVSTTQNVTVLQATDSKCTNIGIQDIGFDSQTTIVPNPSNGNITVSVFGAEKNISIKVFNIIGSEVKTFTANDVNLNFSKSFDMSDLANGTYLVKIQTGDKVSVKRLTIGK